METLEAYLKRRERYRGWKFTPRAKFFDGLVYPKGK